MSKPRFQARGTCALKNIPVPLLIWVGFVLKQQIKAWFQNLNVFKVIE